MEQKIAMLETELALVTKLYAYSRGRNCVMLRDRMEALRTEIANATYA